MRGKAIEAGPADGAHDMDDEVGPGISSNRLRRNRSCGRGRARAQEVPSAENEDENENERAGGEPPARRREGVQHVVNDDNKDVMRGCRKGAETVPSNDVMIRFDGQARDLGYLRLPSRPGELEHLIRRGFTLVLRLATVAHA